jgi:putative acetyltransferase
MVRVAIERPDQPEAVALVDALDAYQKPLYPAESHHGIDIEELLQPDVVFALARTDEGEAAGCGAFVAHGSWAELKRMYVLPALRGRGVAQALLAFLEAEALARGVRVMRLETGNLQPQALRLYERAGYARRGPFGDYDDDPHSVFMEKSLVRSMAAQEAGR